ncbi:MAG: 30S ribosome-binding factor RbfA [Candidatus Neomarinimicrobiota bacterium]
MTSNKPYNRSERVEKQLLEIISSIAIKNIDLSSLGFITFTDVDISPDLKNAKIFFSVLNQKLPDDELEIEINRREKAFKKFLSPELHLRTTPKIQFVNDKKLSYQEKIDSLLKDTPLDQNKSDNNS